MSLDGYPIDEDYVDVPPPTTEEARKSITDRGKPARPRGGYVLSDCVHDPVSMGRARAAKIDAQSEESIPKGGRYFRRWRTNFYEQDVEDPETATVPDWKIHAGLDGPPYHAADDERGHIINHDGRDRALRMECLLSGADFPEHVRKRAVSKALAEDLRGWNSWYGGCEAAVFAFAFEMTYESPEEAMASEQFNSPPFENIEELVKGQRDPETGEFEAAGMRKSPEDLVRKAFEDS